MKESVFQKVTFCVFSHADELTGWFWFYVVDVRLDLLGVQPFPTLVSSKPLADWKSDWNSFIVESRSLRISSKRSSAKIEHWPRRLSDYSDYSTVSFPYLPTLSCISPLKLDV